MPVCTTIRLNKWRMVVASHLLFFWLAFQSGLEQLNPPGRDSHCCQRALHEYAQGQSFTLLILHALNSHQFHWVLTLFANGSIRSPSRDLLCWVWRRWMSRFPVLCVILWLQQKDAGNTRSCHYGFILFSTPLYSLHFYRGLYVMQGSGKDYITVSQYH